MVNFDLDSIINRLTENRGALQPKNINLKENEIRNLCYISQSIFLKQPMLLHIDAPTHICGDIHGHFRDLLRCFDYGGYPPAAQYLFLGDYVDRGKQSIETICLLLAYKIKFPTNFHLLRGNHECANINKVYGFYDECKRRYSTKLWKTFTDCFNCLPVAAIVEEKMFCCHGGLSPELVSMDQIRRIVRPTTVPEAGLLCDLLWSDPDEMSVGWSKSIRGVSYAFGEMVVVDFLNRFNFDVIVRAHQLAMLGYEFFADQRLVTLFTATNYCDEFKNAGAVMTVDSDLVCTFFILEPRVLNTSVWSY